MTVVPADTPVTIPVVDPTVATPGVPDDHVIVCVVAFAGVTDELSVMLEPTDTVVAPLMSEMPVTRIITVMFFVLV